MDELIEALDKRDGVKRRLDAAHLLAIEGNPVTAEDMAMFEMFDRENWPHERRLAFIIEQARALATK